jgi:glucose-1-phosphate thymidylyltransferase
MTKTISKQLLPIYDKPMIYYPLSTLMLANIRDVLIISTAVDINDYKDLLGNGNQIGMSIQYAVQDKPRGLADAFIVGEEFIGSDDVCLVLGDNIFFGQAFSSFLERAIDSSSKATIFGYPVKDPTAFGVVEFDDEGKAISLEEKPQNPKSNFAIPGLYFYDNSVIQIAKTIKPSARGEIEITAINNEYLKRNELSVVKLGRGFAWLDTGTPEGMLKASEFVHSVQDTQGFYVSCIEEIAWRKGFISTEQFKSLGEALSMTDYGKYMLSVID